MEQQKELGKVYTNSGLLKEAGTILNNLKHGYWIEYSEDGKVYSITKYKQGVKHGIHFNFYASGNIYLKAFYVDGSLEGPFTEYYNTGVEFTKSTYKNGSFDGWYPMYLENGELASLFYYDEGVECFVFDFYDKKN